MHAFHFNFRHSVHIFYALEHQALQLCVHQLHAIRLQALYALHAMHLKHPIDV